MSTQFALTESAAPMAQEPGDPAPPWVRAAAAVVVVVAVAIRFVAQSHLWLDEALSVNIAQLPLRDIPGALRHDGAPPLYYVVLHGWIKLFGTGDLAVRSLSGLFGVIALPLAWLAGRRLGGRQVGWTALLLLGACPFAVRYSTEARMYSLVVVLVLVCMLILIGVLDGQRGPARFGLGLATALLLYTHYWALYLVAAVVLVLAVWGVRTPKWRSGARRALVAIGVGSALFIPWVPTLLYQAARTGTPWAGAPRLRVLMDTIIDFAGGYWDPGLGLGILYLALLGLGLWGRPIDSHRIELDLRGHAPGSTLALVCFVTLAIALAMARLTGSAYVVRYTAVILPLVLLLAALGTSVFSSNSLRYGVVAVAVILGFAATIPNVVGERTTAPRVASAIASGASAGDVVAYCPDQVGPSVSRRVRVAGLVQVTFPRATGPEFVDWVDYAEVNRKAQPASFSRMLLDRAGSNDIWVVWSPGYRSFGMSCEQLLGALRIARPDEQRVVRITRRTFERVGLVRFQSESGRAEMRFPPTVSIDPRV